MQMYCIISALSFVLFFFFGFVLPNVRSLQCSSCLKVSDTTQCNSTIQCAVDEKCFTERFGNPPYAHYTLGCNSEKICPTTPAKGFTLVGRDLQTLSVAQCRLCCDTDRCNDQLCDFSNSAPVTVSPVLCMDNETRHSCANLNATIQICKDIQNARAVCKKFCGLCGLVDGNWNSWSSWSTCSVTCGVGTVSRMRTCTKPAPSSGGLQCVGNSTEEFSCLLRLCPVHGDWSTWDSWGSCSKDCGIGIMKRRRECNNPTPSILGRYCFGEAIDVDICNGTTCQPVLTSPIPTSSVSCVDSVASCDVINSTIGLCTDTEKARAICRKYCGLCDLVDGAWNNWSDWGSCSTTCGKGTKSRTRSCSNPRPANGGKQCKGVLKEETVCKDHDCPVHGGWGMWTSWTDCSADCGTGLTHRRRICDNPRPSIFGAPCFGDSVEYNLCLVRSCAVDGGWSTWTAWESCSVTCGPGIRLRKRTCSNPVPSGGGRSCVNDAKEYSSCQTRTCVDGGWSTWGAWESCSVTCGPGIRLRQRTCSNPAPTWGGTSCIDKSKDYSSCQIRSCAGCAFTAVISKNNSYSNRQTIIFDRVLTNEGNGYNATTGKFTAPRQGLYVFSLTIQTYEAWATVELKRGSAAIGYVYADDYSNPSIADTSSVTVTTKINKGDVVFASKFLGDTNVTYSFYYQHFRCFFSGFLVS